MVLLLMIVDMFSVVYFAPVGMDPNQCRLMLWTDVEPWLEIFNSEWFVCCALYYSIY